MRSDNQCLPIAVLRLWCFGLDFLTRILLDFPAAMTYGVEDKS